MVNLKVRNIHTPKIMHVFLKKKIKLFFSFTNLNYISFVGSS